MKLNNSKWIVGGLLIVGVIVLVGLAFPFMSRSSINEILRTEHCAMMPGMGGCEQYRGQYQETSSTFDRSIIGLVSAQETANYPASSGQTMQLSADIVKKDMSGRKIRMFGYNGQIPGPLIKVRQGDTLYVNFTNNLDQETTVHWHGLRLENANDGVPGMTQEPVQSGESFLYKLDFPDAGLYWYHPHVREDYQQELGLYGNIIVTPSDTSLLSPVNEEAFLFLDDIQLGTDGDIMPIYKEKISQVLMGRFGTTLLVNGKTSYDLTVKQGEVVRFYITNAANTRVFNLSIAGAQLKLVGSDGGFYEQERWADSVIIAPSERAVVEAYFNRVGTYDLQNINPAQTYTLGTITVLPEQTETSYASSFVTLRDKDSVKAEVDSLRQYLTQAPDASLRLTIQFPGMQGRGNHGMMGMMHGADEGGIEWEDTMQPMNFASSNRTVNWEIIDQRTGKANEAIDFAWNVGDKVKIRLFNDPNSMHPMQHPIHLHGQRFVVLSMDGVPNDNLVWKDTVLVPMGSTIDILMDVTNPGEWMAHCHIAEHLSDGMMFSFNAEL
ncbi:MAG: multicopper oxidase family protein [Nanoarchaeota archaeon]